jgi:hypothetical protein
LDRLLLDLLLVDLVDLRLDLRDLVFDFVRRDDSDADNMVDGFGLGLIMYILGRIYFFILINK